MNTSGQARFRPDNRLVKTDEFSSVFLFRCKVVSAHLMVYAKPGLPTVARLGVTVSKKTAPLAVTRNYARRVVREVFRRHLAAFAGVDLVIRVQKPFPPKAFSLIETELLGALPTLRAKVEKCRA